MRRFSVFRDRANTILVKMTLVFLLVMVPLVLLLNWINNLGMDVVRNQVAISNANMVSLYMEQIDRNLEEVDKYLYNEAAFNSDLWAMDLSEKIYSKSYWLAKIRLSNQMGADFAKYPMAGALFVHSERNRDLLTVPASASAASRTEAISADIVAAATGKGGEGRFENDRWYVRRSEGAVVLFHIVRMGGVRIGAWVEMDRLIVPLSLIDFGKKGKAILVSDRHEPLNSADFVASNALDLTPAASGYRVSGKAEKFLVVGKESRRGDFGLRAVVPEHVILERLPAVHKLVSSWIPLILVLITCAYLLFLRQVILKPVRMIVRTMREIQSGNMDARIESKRTSVEFTLMDRTFNRMADQIKDLKIRVYEEELRKQRAELQYLQLQVKPHFFMNTLNVVYQLAQVKDYKLIQQMSLRLIEFFRYKFKATAPFVPLREELDHVRAYLDIQQLRFPDFLKYRISADEGLFSFPVPPMMVQTLAENAVKYAMNMDDPIEIAVEAERREEAGRQMVLIHVEDNGTGFSEELLERLRDSAESEEAPAEHIGIRNARHRLSLLYGGLAEIRFANAPSGGALVELSIPYAFPPVPEVRIDA